MSIVLLQGGGLSQDQLNRLALNPKPLRTLLQRWAFGLFRRQGPRGLIGGPR